MFTSSIRITSASVLTLLLVCLKYNTCFPSNGSAALISKYSKVAYWGQPVTSSKHDDSQETEGRSNSGQTLWTHRSDVKISGGQNLKPQKYNIVYAFPVQKKVTKNGFERKDKIAVGEVEDRLSPNPYFAYGPIKNQQLSPVYSPPSQNNPYNSPFDSYNPPTQAPTFQKDDIPAYPPIDQSPSSDPQPQPIQQPSDSYASPPETTSGSGGPYTRKPDDSQISPPQESPKDYPSYGSSSNSQFGTTKDHEDVYFPPDDSSNNHHHDEVILDHPPPGYEDEQEDNFHDTMGKGHDHNVDDDMAEGDLNPPPPDFGKPQFQSSDNFGPGYGAPGANDLGAYDFDHHHVYEEVEAPHTNPPPQDERVNKEHYSYYYLGRKLWYIPLYFSVYFIIYVTVLIFKSIARHKIHLKHELHDKFRRGRDLKLEEINDLHKNVTTALQVSEKRFVPALNV